MRSERILTSPDLFEEPEEVFTDDALDFGVAVTSGYKTLGDVWHVSHPAISPVLVQCTEPGLVNVLRILVHVRHPVHGAVKVHVAAESNMLCTN